MSVDFARIREIAKAIVDGKSRSYVDDAKELAAVFRKLDYEEMWNNLTATQHRCTTLLNEARTSALSRDARQERAINWVRTTFGDVNATSRERALRFIEEAIELAQAENLSVEEVSAVLSHVYSKPAGNPSQEVGGVGVTLLGYCAVKSISADHEEAAELARVISVDPNHFRKRHNVKAEAGIAVRAKEPTT